MTDEQIESEIALSSRTRFVLDDEQWAKFMEMLERPVTTEKSAMKKLLTEPSALECRTGGYGSDLWETRY
jgi:uncharacterized protein (DUF1778 family)